MTSTALLGYVGETNARPVLVEGMEIDGADRYVLTIDYGDGTVYVVDITGGQWTPTADILRSAQTVSCQICAKKLSGNEYILLKKSRIFRLRIGAAIGDVAVPSPSVAADALDRIDAIGTQVAADRKAAETAAQTAQSIADSLPDDYTTAVGKIAENTAEIGRIKLTDKELQMRVDALFDIGQGVTHKFETDSETAYAKTVPTGAKLMSVKSIGGHSEVIDGEIVSTGVTEVVEQGKNLWDEVWGVGSINASSGNDEGSKEAIYSKSYTPIIPNSTYIFVYAGSDKIENVKTRFYDINKKYIGYNDNNGQIVYPNRAFITPLNAAYVRFTLPPGYGNVYKNDIALIAGSSGTYAPFHRNEYPIPEAIKALPGYGWSAGTAKNYVDYENKRYVQCVDSVDLGTLTFTLINGRFFVHTSNSFDGLIKKPSSTTQCLNAICSQFTAISYADNWADHTVTCYVTENEK